MFIREKTPDQLEQEAYWSRASATLEGRPMKVLATYGRHLTLEGPEVEGIVVAEFPSVEEARAWYDSPAYQEVAVLCLSGIVLMGALAESRNRTADETSRDRE